MDLDALYQAACEVRLRAYAPYSNFLVGAALLTSTSDEIFVGCNVENASYGGTICAERSAILNAVSALGGIQIRGMVLVTDTRPVASPCGFCRQVMNEFMPADAPIHLANLGGIQVETTLAELLPRSFGPQDLQS